MRLTPLTPSAFSRRSRSSGVARSVAVASVGVGVDAQPLAVGVQNGGQPEPLDVHGEARAAQTREQLARGGRLADTAIELRLDEGQSR